MRFRTRVVWMAESERPAKQRVHHKSPSRAVKCKDAPRHVAKICVDASKGMIKRLLFASSVKGTASERPRVRLVSAQYHLHLSCYRPPLEGPLAILSHERLAGTCHQTRQSHPDGADDRRRVQSTTSPAHSRRGRRAVQSSPPQPPRPAASSDLA